MVFEIKFKTEAYFTATVELNKKQAAAFKKNLVDNTWIGGNEPKADGFRTFFTRNSEFDYIENPVDIEDVTMELLPNYPFSNDYEH